MALPIDKIRIRKSGTHAGHNGLKDIQNILGTDEYPKLRFGIGNVFPKGMQVDFVLGKWKKDEVPVVQMKIEKSVEIIERFAFEGIDRTMTAYNNLNFNARLYSIIVLRRYTINFDAWMLFLGARDLRKNEF